MGDGGTQSVWCAGNCLRTVTRSQQRLGTVGQFTVWLSFGSNPDQALAEILTSVQTGNRTGRVLDAIEHVFPIANSPGADPRFEFLQRLGKSWRMVEHEK